MGCGGCVRGAVERVFRVGEGDDAFKDRTDVHPLPLISRPTPAPDFHSVTLAWGLPKVWRGNNFPVVVGRGSR